MKKAVTCHLLAFFCLLLLSTGSAHAKALYTLPAAVTENSATGKNGHGLKDIAFIQAEALTAPAHGNMGAAGSSRLHECSKKISFSLQARLFLLSRYGLCALHEIFRKSTGISPPLYLVNCILII
jgi:hypothetical protein